MIKLENVKVYGWEAAIRGMRNPMNSWDKSDSDWEFVEDPSIINPNDVVKWVIGESDLKLMHSLAHAGDDHGKFLRMITVTVDITAPLYWWKEFDTYKVGTVANSCSTMHKIHAKEFTLDDFSHEHLFGEGSPIIVDYGLELFDPDLLLDLTIKMLNCVRVQYLETRDKGYWWQMIQLLPTSYNQRRTVQLNYQVLKHMYHSRWNHKLDEWVYFCEWMHTLPHFKEICLNA